MLGTGQKVGLLLLSLQEPWIFPQEQPSVKIALVLSKETVEGRMVEEAEVKHITVLGQMGITSVLVQILQQPSKAVGAGVERQTLVAKTIPQAVVLEVRVRVAVAVDPMAVAEEAVGMGVLEREG
jgi:hypothetical protein